ncbi:hypothetical protein [Kocuria sp. LHG3120]
MALSSGGAQGEDPQRTADLMQRHGITGDRLEVSDLVAEPVR